MFPLFNCYQILQLNCKFKRLVVRPKYLTLLVEIMLKIAEKSLLTLVDVG